MVHPTVPLTGASLFGDSQQAPLTGHYHRIPAEFLLPQGVTITADGIDAGGTHPPTHYTVSLTEPMSYTDFVDKFVGLPWTCGGKK
jgi:hypothetical protein